MYVFLPLCIALILLFLAFSIHHYAGVQQTVSQLEVEVSETRQMREQAMLDWQSINERLSDENYVLYYEYLVHYLQQHWAAPEQILDELVGPLPANAHWSNINYNSNGRLTMNIHVQRMRHISDYMDEVLRGGFVQTIHLLDIQSLPEDGYLGSLDVTVQTTTGGSQSNE